MNIQCQWLACLASSTGLRQGNLDAPKQQRQFWGFSVTWKVLDLHHQPWAGREWFVVKKAQARWANKKGRIFFPYNTVSVQFFSEKIGGFGS